LFQYNDERKRKNDHKDCNQPVDTHHARSELGSISQIVPVDVVRSTGIRNLRKFLEDVLLLYFFSRFVAAASAALENAASLACTVSFVRLFHKI
jgi:hypothetical protein